MNENNLGISQQTLVSNTMDQIVPAKKLLQYIASLSATLGALASGMVLAWTASAGPDGKYLQSLYGFQINPHEFSWIGSLSALGAVAISIPIGILTDIIGRKYLMLFMVIPFIIGWLVIIFANSVLMFGIGRFITGISVGAFCVLAPLYTAEIALSSICVFVVMFSLGFGPIPWLMLGEIFAPEVKGLAASSASLLNWLMVFIITKFYTNLKMAIDTSGAFWLFSGICALGIFFVFFLVPETAAHSRLHSAILNFSHHY